MSEARRLVAPWQLQGFGTNSERNRGQPNGNRHADRNEKRP